MRRTAPTATLLACLTLLVGCSSTPETADRGPGLSASIAGAGSGAGAKAEPVSDNSPLKGLSALAVWEKTKAEADASPSVHVAARYLDGEQLNLKMDEKGKVFGTLRLHGQRVLVRRLGQNLYVKAGAPFWTGNVGAAKANKLAFEWVLVRRARTADLQQILQLTDMDYLVADLMSLSAPEQQTLKLVPGVTVNRRATVGLADESGGEPAQFRKLYVSATGPSLPLNFTVGTDNSQYMKFRSWGKDFTGIAPKGAVDLVTGR